MIWYPPPAEILPDGNLPAKDSACLDLVAGILCDAFGLLGICPREFVWQDFLTCWKFYQLGFCPLSFCLPGFCPSGNSSTWTLSAGTYCLLGFCLLEFSLQEICWSTGVLSVLSFPSALGNLDCRTIPSAIGNLDCRSIPSALGNLDCQTVDQFPLLLII